MEYVSDLGRIQETLQSAYATAIVCIKNVGQEDAYQGEALEEMEAFFQSLEAHLQKMILLYQVASAYVSKVYTEMYYNEEQLISWAVQELQGGR